MHAHIYGKKHFKHKTNFKDLVVFSDVTQNKIATELPSETLYFEVEKGYDDADKWFIHLNSTLSGEYGDFYTQENPIPVGEIKKLQYDTDNDISALNDFLIDGALPYYRINERFYVKIENAALLDEVFVGKQPKSNQKSIEYDAFTTVFISEDGAQLLQAYEAIQQVNAHEVVIFIERNSGINAFRTVFRIKQGANVKALIETNRTRIAEIARAYGVDVLANELSTMIAEELKKQKESKFYFMLPSGGGRIIRWTANATLGTVSEIFKEVSSGIEGFKLGDDYWKTEVDGKENPKYNPLLPKLNFNEKFSSEELANKIYKERIVPLEIPIIGFAKELNEHWLFKKIVPFKSERILKLFQNIPSILKEFFDGVKNNLQNTYDFVNGLLVGLLNSIVDFFKSIFDILAILVDVLNGIIQSTKFFEKPGHYLSMLVEGFENLIDLVLNTFTLKNLKAWVQFLIYLPVATAQVLVGLYTKTSNTSVAIDPGALGYYTGFLVGFIGSEVVQFIATGGTANIAKATRAVLKSYKELAKVVVEKTVQTTELTVEVVLAMYRKLDEFVKNIPKHLDDLKTWVKEFVEKLASISSQLFKGFEAVLDLLFDLGVVIAEKLDPTMGKAIVQGVDGTVYVVKQGDRTILEGTEDAIRKFAQRIDEIRSSGGNARKKVQSYLDEISKVKERLKVLKENPDFTYEIENVTGALGKWLSRELEAVVRYYTTSAYEELNDALRGFGSMTKQLRAFEKTLNYALSKLPNIDYHGINNSLLYRSVRFSEELILKIKNEGKFIDKGFFSTAHNYQMFLDNWLSYSKHHNVIFKVYGKNGKLIDAASDIPEEAEVLFKSGTEFDVLSVIKIDHPIPSEARIGKEMYEIILKEK